jgi:hypothetical protein
MARSALRKRHDQGQNRQFGDSFYNNDTLAEHGIEVYKARDKGNSVLIVQPNFSLDGAGQLEEYWGHLFAAHFNMGVNRSRFACPEYTGMYECPCCDEWKKAKMNDDEELEKKYRYKMQMAYYVIDLHDNPDTKIAPENVKLWVASEYAIDRELSAACIKRTRKKGEFVDVEVYITDPAKPYIVTFEKTGSQLSTRYSRFELIEAEPYDLSVFSKLPPIEDVIQYYDTDHMSRVVRLGATEDKADSFEDAPEVAPDEEDLLSRVRNRVEGKGK